jgi:hypothetical protein
VANISAPGGQKLRRTLTIGLLPLAGGLVAVLAFASGTVAPPQRLLYYLDAANPLHTIENIHAAGRRMSETVFKYKYSRDDASSVLFFGRLSTIPLKFIKAEKQIQHTA